MKREELREEQKRRANGLVIETYDPEIGQNHVYNIDVDMDPFLEDLDERNASADEVLWQVGWVKKCLGPRNLARDMSNFYCKDSLRSDLGRLNYFRSIYFVHPEKLEDKELQEILGELDKNIKESFASTCNIFRIRHDYPPYSFTPGYRWNKGIEIYEDREGKGKVMKEFQKIKEGK